MLNKGGFLDAESYNMILARKFPNGTASKDVLAYVKEQDGKCTQQEDSYSCKIYYYATLCISQSVELRFKELTELKTIYDLNAVHRFDGC